MCAVCGRFSLLCGAVCGRGGGRRSAAAAIASARPPNRIRADSSISMCDCASSSSSCASRSSCA
eukprot:scaffold27777_cov129-Isochrysis_galbana.AAC.4